MDEERLDEGMDDDRIDDDGDDDGIDDDGMDEAVEQMADLVAYIAKQLVDDPKAVTVTPIDADRNVVFELSVASGDLGKVIGKDGRTARAMRTLLAATSAKLRKRAVLDILE